MSLADIQAQHRRLAILRLLAKSAGYSANDSILDDALDHLGAPGSRDQVKADLGFLEEVGCIAIERFEHLMIATATQAGLDVARGDKRIEGIKRPSPSERI